MQQGLNLVARFNSRVKQLLLEKGAARGEPISQRQLAKDTNIALSTVSRWYRNDDLDRLDADTVLAFMQYFDCSMSDLVEVVPD